jgi:hypothetical protein
VPGRAALPSQLGLRDDRSSYIASAARAYGQAVLRRYAVGKTLTYAEIKAGRLRAVKVGFRTLILHDDSEAWVRSLPEVAP